MNQVQVEADGSELAGVPNARVLTVASLKGGVGRTTLAVNLAAMLALTERDILLIDLDPLGAATAALGLARVDSEGQMAAFSKPEPLMDYLVAMPGRPRLKVWRGGSALNEIEARLWNKPEPQRDLVLEEALSAARKTFDLILVDAPPNQGPLGRNALACADDLLIPVPGHAFDCITIERTISLLRSVRPASAPPLRVFCVCVGGAGEGFKPEDLPGHCRSDISVLNTSIVDEGRLCARAAEAGQTLLEFAPGARLTRSIVELSREIRDLCFDEGHPVSLQSSVEASVGS